MFRTFGNTLRLARTAWRVLETEGLLMFPATLGVSILVILFYVLAAFNYGGTFGRLSRDFQVLPADFIFLGLAYLGGVFVVTYFSAALVAAAHYRVIGGVPDFRFGLEAANDRLGALAVWALVVSTAGVVCRRFGAGNSERRGDLLGALRAGGATSLVTPAMMVEGAPPLDSMRRAAELYRETWGHKTTANYGFGLLYVMLLAPALGVTAGLAAMEASSSLAVIAGLVPFTLAAATLKCLEVVYVVALYNYAAVGETDGVFAEEALAGAFVPRHARGKFGPRPVRRKMAA